MVALALALGEELFVSDEVAGILRIPVPGDRLAESCRRWKITELCVFGSALRDDFRPESDVDLLVTFAPDAAWHFDDLLDMKEELETIFGRPVDLIERRLIETSENYIRRRHILQNLVSIYRA